MITNEKTILLDFTIPWLYNSGIRRMFLNLSEKLIQEYPLFNYDIIIPSKISELDTDFFNFNSNINFSHLPYPPKIPFLHRVWYHECTLNKFLQKNNNYSFLISPYFQLPLSCKGENVFSTIHDMLFFDLKDNYNSFSEKGFITYYNNCLKRSINNEHTILTVSDFSKERILHYFDIDEKKILVIPNSIDKFFFDKLVFKKINNNIIRKDITCYFNRPYILYTGGSEKRKNLLNLFIGYTTAFASLKDKPILVCTGNEQTMILKSIEKDITLRKYISDIYFTGRNNLDELAALYHNALFVVNASLYEGFGLPILETLLAKKRICCSDIRVFREIAGNHAIYFDPYCVIDISDKLMYLYNNVESALYDYNSAFLQAMYYQNFSQYNILDSFERQKSV